LTLGQVLGRYSRKATPRIYNLTTMLYLAVFLAAIVCPLFVLAQVSQLSVQLSLTLAATCLVLLVPHFWSFRSKLDPNQVNLAQWSPGDESFDFVIKVDQA